MGVNLSNEFLRKLMRKIILDNALHMMWAHKKWYSSYSF